MSIDHCQTCNTTYDTDVIEHECVEEEKDKKARMLLIGATFRKIPLDDRWVSWEHYKYSQHYEPRPFEAVLKANVEMFWRVFPDEELELSEFEQKGYDLIRKSELLIL